MRLPSEEIKDCNCKIF